MIEKHQTQLFGGTLEKEKERLRRTSAMEAECLSEKASWGSILKTTKAEASFWEKIVMEARGKNSGEFDRD